MSGSGSLVCREQAEMAASGRAERGGKHKKMRRQDSCASAEAVVVCVCVGGVEVGVQCRVDRRVLKRSLSAGKFYYMTSNDLIPSWKKRKVECPESPVRNRVDMQTLHWLPTWNLLAHFAGPQCETRVKASTQRRLKK